MYFLCLPWQIYHWNNLEGQVQIKNSRTPQSWTPDYGSIGRAYLWPQIAVEICSKGGTDHCALFFFPSTFHPASERPPVHIKILSVPHAEPPLGHNSSSGFYIPVLRIDPSKRLREWASGIWARKVWRTGYLDHSPAVKVQPVSGEAAWPVHSTPCGEWQHESRALWSTELSTRLPFPYLRTAFPPSINRESTSGGHMGLLKT